MQRLAGSAGILPALFRSRLAAGWKPTSGLPAAHRVSPPRAASPGGALRPPAVRRVSPAVRGVPRPWAAAARHERTGRTARGAPPSRRAPPARRRDGAHDRGTGRTATGHGARRRDRMQRRRDRARRRGTGRPPRGRGGRRGDAARGEEVRLPVRRRRAASADAETLEPRGDLRIGGSSRVAAPSAPPDRAEERRPGKSPPGPPERFNPRLRPPASARSVRSPRRRPP
jgi:hypothetical protein